MTPQERADLKEIARKLVLQINEITPMQWDKHDDKDQAIVLAALQTTRRAALMEAAQRADLGDCNSLLDAPCLWCGYNGEGYWQPTTHDLACPWHNVGGRFDRVVALDRLAQEG
jgi:hypothetical protein